MNASFTGPPSTSSSTSRSRPTAMNFMDDDEVCLFHQ
jgi:hypothetical protein